MLHHVEAAVLVLECAWTVEVVIVRSLDQDFRVSYLLLFSDCSDPEVARPNIAGEEPGLGLVRFYWVFIVRAHALHPCLAI